MFGLGPTRPASRQHKSFSHTLHVNLQFVCYCAAAASLLFHRSYKVRNISLHHAVRQLSMYIKQALLHQKVLTLNQ